MPMPRDSAEAASWCLFVRKKRITSASSKSWIGTERSISTNKKRAGEKKAGPVIRVKARRPSTAASVASQRDLGAVSSSETAGSPRMATAAAGTEEVVPVYEEQLRVGKRDVSHGRVRIRSYVVETPVNEQVRLHSESVQVERKPVDRPVAAGDALFQDRVIEAEERAEEAVVGKETRVKEELTLRKTAADRTQDISDTVRHTEVEIQDDRGGRLASSASDVSGQIAEHMDVIASDGVKIGTVDHLDGPDKIKLAKSTSPDGQHHYIPLTWVDHVDTHVHLTQGQR